MIRGVALLLLCQLAGEAIARSLSLPVPGPVLGLAFLVAGLALSRRSPEALERAEVVRVANGLLASLGLLFVPAGVGVVQQLPVLASYGVPLALALLVSTVATLLVTVGVFLVVSRRLGTRA